MKNHTLYLVAFIITLASSSSFAQTEKGNFLVGGSFSASHISAPGTTATTASFSPNVSYFFVDRLAAGVILSVSSSKSTIDAAPAFDSKSNSISAGPTVRYYFPVTEKIAVFPQVDLTWGKQTNNSNQNGVTNTSTTNTTTLRTGAGVTYFIATNVGVEAALYYQAFSASSANGNFTASSDQSTVGFRIGLQIYINRNK